MIQKSTQLFESSCEKAKVYVDNDMSLGAFYDFLTELRGVVIEKIISHQKEQQESLESKRE